MPKKVMAQLKKKSNKEEVEFLWNSGWITSSRFFNQQPQKTEFSYLDNNPRGKILLLSNFQRKFLAQIVSRMED